MEDHAAEHLRPGGDFGILPLKCNIVQFQHNLIRPGLYPSCRGDEAVANLTTRFYQYTNITEWKRHLIRYLHCDGLGL